MSFIHIITTEKKLETCSLSFFFKSQKGREKYTVVENPTYSGHLEKLDFQALCFERSWGKPFQLNGQGREKSSLFAFRLFYLTTHNSVCY